jgi:adenosylcobyric acid synthase
MAKPIMIQGTMSNAGKSLIVTGLCRIFAQDGYRVAPFKSQNMALNSFITDENLEMGRAQAVQAYACGIEPKVCMNPILLKPLTDMGSQVIVNGEVVGNMRASEYFQKKKEYIPDIMEAYSRLNEEYDIIVIEGAGSPAEINLKKDDIVNMGLAELVDAPVLLVGDIDRGGVFAQLAGTVTLLEENERERIKGLIINKFRGDLKILEPGLSMLEEKCGKEVLGVVPYADVDIEEEDSLADDFLRRNVRGSIDIAVIQLPKISNFTDFQALSMEKALSVRYVGKLSELGSPDMVIIPGTKNTISDLKWLRECGLEAAIIKFAKKGGIVMGICGGYQMLGETISDEEGSEGAKGSIINGMALLPVITYFEAEKTRTRVSGHTGCFEGSAATLSGKKVRGYEIHMGRTVPKDDTDSEMLCFNRLENKNDGFIRGNIIGTYLHGIFDEDDFRDAFTDFLCDKKGISRIQETESRSSFEKYREEQYDKLADIVRNSLNMDKIHKLLL